MTIAYDFVKQRFPPAIWPYMPGNSSPFFARFSRSTATVTSLLLHAGVFGTLVFWAWWESENSGPQFGARRGANLVALAYIPSQEATAPDPAHFAQLPNAEHSKERPLETKPLPRARQIQNLAVNLPLLQDPDIEAEEKPKPAVTPPLAAPKPQTPTANKNLDIKRGELSKARAGQNASIGSQGASEYKAGKLDPSHHLEHPPEMLRRKLGGKLILELHIAADGKVTRVFLLQSSGHSLYDEESIKKAYQWRGTPARRAGVPIETIETQEITFNAPR